MTRRTAVAAPAQPPNDEYLLAMIGTLSLLELLRLKTMLDALLERRRREERLSAPPPTERS